MEITVMTGLPEKLRANVLVVGAFADGTLPLPAQALDTGTALPFLGLHSWRTFP
jgi:hypothetical protein